jgi:hypothetical protein
MSKRYTPTLPKTIHAGILIYWHTEILPVYSHIGKPKLPKTFHAGPRDRRKMWTMIHEPDLNPRPITSFFLKCVVV